MRSWFFVGLTVLAFPLLCGVIFVVLFVALVGLTIPQLPAWAQGPVSQWMSDSLQESYDNTEWIGPPGSPYNGGQVPYDGYIGPRSFQCLLPPEYGYVTDIYGVSRPGGYMHSGIDYGTYYRPVPVRTPMGGKVTYAGWSRAGYGLLVVVENAGYQVYLAHNTEIYVSVGQIVGAGEGVALSGTTGASSGYHVHFEARVWDGNRWAPRDPNAVFLPGQGEACDWYSLSTGPPPATP